MKKVIITGATGFIGTALSKRLLDLGVEVIALSRSLDVPESLCANEKYQHVCMDVNDISKLETMPINTMEKNDLYSLQNNSHLF